MQMQHQHIVPIYIEDEVKQSYLDYSMSVIVSRALPDVRDGLKPSQRRILMAMHDLNLEPGRAHRKCAKIAGDTSGNYHPHGEAVIYPTLARMAQDFNMRYTLVDGQGNFGCFTGDTKVKLLDGTDRSFEELARMYGPDEVFYVYSVDHEGKVVVGEGRNSRVSRQDAEVIELELDSGEVIRCTPDHRFMLRDGSYKQAQDLTTDDSLMPGYDGKLKYQNPNVKTAPCPTSTEEVGGVLSFELCHLTFPDRIVAKRFLKERFDVYDITVESHHNFLLSSGVFVHNSIDGDPPGAMRYTEARMAAPAVELLADLEKDTVDFVPNYDDTRKEPVVLPGKFPNLICNGCSGIAVGMATNIPPHNLSEVVDALLALIEDSELDCDGLMRYVSGPDFPTGGIIYGIEGVQTAYRTGRGRVVIRARATIEKLKNGRENIVITEIPFMVTKASLIENIADLVRQKKIEGISDLRDESDREGLRIVIELRRDAYASVILNQLYTRTRLQNSFGVIMLALVDGQPVTLNLKEVLAYFLEHRHRVVVRRTQFELDRAQKRAHIVEGLRVALDHMDRVIALIRKARDREAAREGLMEQFRLSEAQVDAILDMRLQRLTGLERRRVGDEYLGLIKEITRLEGILMSRPQRMAIIRSELEALREKYGDDRRTEVIASAEEFSIEDLIAEENMVITISHAGYIKRTPIATYRRQRRGGRGGTGMTTRDEDFVEHLFIASTHSYILFLTERGHCYWLKVHEIPEAGRVARGRSVANLLEMGREETIAAIVPVREFDEEHFLLMATQQGLVKKTVLSAYGRPRRDGIVAVDIVSGDRLIEAKLTDGTQDVILATRRGQSIRFRESDVRAMGRATRGVTGISLRDGDEVVSMVAVKRQGTLIMVCRNGYGKRTPVQDYPVIRRGGKGVIGIKTTDRNGELIAAKEVVDNDELMIISQGGILIRLPIRDVSVIGRNTQGVRLIHLDPEDLVVDVTYIMTDGAQERELEEEAEEAVEESADAHHPEAVSDEAADASETDDQNGGSQVALDLFATGSSEDEGEQ